MKREGIILSTFLIERPGQVKLFQVRIPREAENIIGVEMGMHWLQGAPPAPLPPAIWSLPMTLQRNLLVGELKLQSYEKANMFFSTELAINNNLSFADFSSQFFNPRPHTHAYPQHEDPIKVNGNTTLLQGAYRDKLSEHYAGAYKYIVKVYIWIAAKEDQSNL